MNRTLRILMLTAIGTLALLVFGGHASAHAAPVLADQLAYVPTAYPYQLHSLSPQLTADLYLAAFYLAIFGIMLIGDLPSHLWNWALTITGKFRPVPALPSNLSKAR